MPEPESREAPALEQRLARIEAIVERLESSDLDLEEAMRLFEEGVAHLREAQRVIRESELRIERLLDDGAGGTLLEPADGG